MTGFLWNILKIPSRDMKGKFTGASLKAVMEEKTNLFLTSPYVAKAVHCTNYIQTP